MQWWMWIIAVVLCIIGIFCWVNIGTAEDGVIAFCVGFVFIAIAVLGTIYFKHSRPSQQREHTKALTEIRQQGFATRENDDIFEVVAKAGNCLLPLHRHKVNGTYRLEIPVVIQLPQGATKRANAPIDTKFLAEVGQLAPCK